ncbi:MAG: uracil phosphoribosyltransferase [Pirellulaceae bacterium]
MAHCLVVDHPLVQHHLRGLRDVTTSPAEFRRLAHRLAALVAYEATRDLPLAAAPVHTPLAAAPAVRLNARVGLVPILRAGLGMVDPVLDLLPEAEVWHLGLYRDEATALPVEYYRKLPADEPVDVAIVLDPMLATGGSVMAALGALRKWGAGRLKVCSLIAARPGVEALLNEFPEAQLYVCAIDPELNQHKFIVPGLGDAGDRIFNTLPRESR